MTTPWLWLKNSISIRLQMEFISMITTDSHLLSLDQFWLSFRLSLSLLSSRKLRLMTDNSVLFTISQLIKETAMSPITTIKISSLLLFNSQLLWILNRMWFTQIKLFTNSLKFSLNQLLSTTLVSEQARCKHSSDKVRMSLELSRLKAISNSIDWYSGCLFLWIIFDFFKFFASF